MEKEKVETAGENVAILSAPKISHPIPHAECILLARVIQSKSDYSTWLAGVIGS